MSGKVTNDVVPEAFATNRSHTNTEHELENDFTLTVGKLFTNYETLSMCVAAFCREHYHPFVIRTRSQKQILYKCCHGVKQNSRCQGKRPKQRYYYKGCQAQINFYKGKNEKWRLTKMFLEHNHTIGKDEYFKKSKRTNEIDYDMATMYVNVAMEEDNENEEIECQRVLSEHEKYSIALDIVRNIADFVSNHEMETFNKYIEELKLIEQNARNGVTLFHPESVDSNETSNIETENLKPTSPAPLNLSNN